VEEKLPETLTNMLAMGADLKIRYQDRLRVLSGGEKLGLKENNVISFPPNHLEKYTFFGKEYYLINEKSIFGVWKHQKKNELIVVE